MNQKNERQPRNKPGQAPGGLVGNYQESAREPTEQEDCERAPGNLVGNYQKGQPDCGPEHAPGRPRR